MTNDTNKVIHEFLGKCWHELERRPYTGSKIGSESFCKHCDELMSGGFTGIPNYTTDLNAVREAELKAIEVFGRLKYGETLLDAIGTVTDPYLSCVTAPASVRASAIVKLIKENDDE